MAHLVHYCAYVLSKYFGVSPLGKGKVQYLL